MWTNRSAWLLRRLSALFSSTRLAWGSSSTQKAEVSGSVCLFADLPPNLQALQVQFYSYFLRDTLRKNLPSSFSSFKLLGQQDREDDFLAAGGVSSSLKAQDTVRDINYAPDKCLLRGWLSGTGGKGLSFAGDKWDNGGGDPLSVIRVLPRAI